MFIVFTTNKKIKGCHPTTFYQLVNLNLNAIKEKTTLQI